MDKTNGEAIPQKNTATDQIKINPIKFPEAFIDEILTKQSEIEQPAEETVDSNQTELDAEVQDSTEKPDVSETDVEDEAHSQSEENEDQADDDSEEQSRVQKRINQLTAKAKEAQERSELLSRELDDARQKLEELSLSSQQGTYRSPNDSITESIWDFNQLNAKRDEALELQEWCIDNPDGGVYKGKEFTAQEVKNGHKVLNRLIHRDIPNREKYLNQYLHYKPIAEQIYPFWKDRSSQEYQEAHAFLNAYPQLKSNAEYQILIGDALEGRRARIQRQKAQSEHKQVVKKAPSQPAQVRSAPVKRNNEAEASSALRSKFSKTSGENELAGLIADRFKL